ncbi:MAG: TIM barrel protein [Methylomicrobium sp.]
MIKFSANLSLLFTEVPLLERFDSAKEAGFQAVEIQFPYHEHIDTIRAKLDQTGLKLVLFNVDADDLLSGGEGLAAVPEKRDRFKVALQQAVDYAEALQPEVINVLPGRCLNPKYLDAYQKTYAENLLLAADTFGQLGIKTVFEAINPIDMPGFIIYNGKQMLALLDRLRHPNLSMQVDIYHFAMNGEGENIGDFIANHTSSIGHIQFADCPGRGQPGTGHIDFQQLFNSIAKSSYKGWIGAEYKPVGHTLSSLSWLDPFQSEKL